MTNKFRFLICSWISLLFLAGCASTPFGSFGNLKQDSSTRQDVRNMLGEPANIQPGDSEEIWEYLFVSQDRREMANKSTALKVLIYFDDDVVKRYIISPTEGVAGGPMPPRREQMPPMPPPRPRFRNY